MRGAKWVGDREYRRIALLGLSLISFLIAACNGGGGGSSPAPSSGPQLCSEAFVPLAQRAAVHAAMPSASPTAVPLSSCPRDANQNVVIGPGACGPLVEVDKSFTASAGNALGTITVNSGGGLAFLTDTSVTVQTVGIRG
jgi:hypothetical protein